MALLIRNVTLIDGTGAPPVDGASIAIDGDRIVGVGRDVAAPDGAETIDARGLWATPGLIDTHMHLELVSRDALPLWLATGVTTVRDLGGDLNFLLETRRMMQNGLAGPRLLFTGPMVDGVPPTWPMLVNSTPNAEAAEQAVDQYLAAGVDAIKLYTTLPLESLRRCINRVDRRVPVTGHLGATRASEAMEAGINGLEHALLTPYNDFAPPELRTKPDEVMMSPGFFGKIIPGWLQADMSSDESKRWVELLVERDVSFCPTLTVLPGAGDEPDPEELQYSRTVADRWLEATSQRENIQIPPDFKAIALRVRETLQQLVAMVQRAGGRVVAGTDTGAIRSLVPGFSLHYELRLLSGAGLSNMELLRCATARAAEALWRDDLGTIENGKRADVLLLRRNPLDDVRALRDIQTVIKNGVAYDPKPLLAQAKTSSAS